MTSAVKKLFPLFILLLFSCQKQSQVEEIVGKTMGTTFSVKYYPTEKSPPRSEVSALINTELRRINSLMSTYKRDSEITRFNNLAANEDFSISTEFLNVLKTAIMVAIKSEGYFDPTIGPLVNLWGFGPDGIKEVPSDQMIEQTLKKVGYDKLVLNIDQSLLSKKVDGVYVDLSASAKGYGVDSITKLLLDKKISHFMVEIGGEVRTKGKNGNRHWRIAIESPNPKTNKPYNSVLELSNHAVATSGSYRNFYTKEGKTFSHTINPKDGKPITHNLVSATVINSDSCMLADTYATALLAIGGENAFLKAKEWGLKAIFIYQHEKNGEKVFSQKKTFDTL